MTPDNKHIRHELSTALSFMNTSVASLKAGRENTSRAEALYDIGADKIRSAISRLDRELKAATFAEALGYNGTREETYTNENAEVAQWRGYFEQKAKSLRIFEIFEATSPRSEARARVVAALWYQFSEFMPWFLCQAAANVSSNEKRHYVIQTAFEELGMRDVREIHCEMFKDAASFSVNAGETSNEGIGLAGRSVLEGLARDLHSYRSDEKILGILLGLEIPATENIEAVFHSLGVSRSVTEKLNLHPFFQLHRQIETEHVRLTVSNFLRFCPTDKQREDFTHGCMDGLKFWSRFWENASALILKEAAEVANELNS